MINHRLTSFSKIAEGIWVAVAEPEKVNIGLVVGNAGALVIDTGSSGEQGAEIRAAAAKIAKVPIVGVFITHNHYDHVGGLAAFADLPAYGHEDVPGVSNGFALAKVVWLGDRPVELVHFGPAHTQTDAAAIIPDADVIFTGDLLESTGPPQFDADSSFKGWAKALDPILGTLNENSILVPGHGEPFNRDFAFDQQQRIGSIYGNMQYLRQHLVPIESAFAEVPWPYEQHIIDALLPYAYDQIQTSGSSWSRQLSLTLQ